MITVKDDERFQNGAREYASYLETPEGRLRTDLAFANLRDLLPSQPNIAMHALDIGCGTGTIGLRLAQFGCQVCLLDSSQAMLDIARHTAEKNAIADRVTLQHGEASQLANLLPAASFDIIVCHNVLEFAEDPAVVLRGAARALRNQTAILSVVVRNQAGEVIKAALQAGDLAAAEVNLTAESACESLYGGSVRLFTPDTLLALLRAESLAPIAERGIRVLADYLPSSVSRSDEYQRILELEKKLGYRTEFARVARYTQIVARSVETGA